MVDVVGHEPVELALVPYVAVKIAYPLAGVLLLAAVLGTIRQRP